MRLYRHAKDGAQELVADFDNGIFNAQVVDRGIGREIIDGGFRLVVIKAGENYILVASGFPVVYITVSDGAIRRVSVGGELGGFGVEVDRHGVSWLLESEVYRLLP